MARRSSPSRGSALGRGRAPSPVSSRRPAPPPQQSRSVAPQPKAQAVGQPAPAAAAPGGGFLAQAASTAVGTAVGVTAAHAITGAIMGGGSRGEVASADQPQQHQQQYYGQQESNQDPCKFELEQFINCAQSQSNDLTLCDGFNQVLKECKVRYGGARMYQ